MMKRIQRRLFRERRRFAYLMVLWFFAVLWMLLQNADYFSPLITTLASLITAAILAGASALVTSAIPFMRSMVMVLPYAMLHTALFRSEALSGMDPELRQIISPATLIGPIILFSVVASWKRLYRFGQRPVRFEVHAKSRLSAYTLYDGLIGHPDTKSAMAEPEAILSFETHPDDPRIQRLVERHGKVELEIIREMQIEDPPLHCRYTWHLPAADARLGNSSGTVTFTIEDQGAHRRVTQVAELDRLPLQVRIYTWLDDYFGKSLDRNVRLLEQRARAAGDTPEETVFG